MRKLLYLIIFCFISFIGCKSETKQKIDKLPRINIQEKKIFSIGNIHVDNQFDGARCNGFTKLNDSIYQILITPENKPINKSAWYAFKIWSEEKQTITLEIDYPEFEHRYAPKMSHDGKNWSNILEKNSRKFKIEISPDTTWVSAQEIISSKDIEDWMTRQADHNFVKNEIIGKSTLGRSMHLMKIKEGQPKHKMLIIGRQHPPEIPGGTLSLFAFIEEILKDTPTSKKFRQHVEVLVFPNMNPDGVDLGHWRHNANGVDLNRDWQDFKEKETQLVRNLLQSNTKGQWIYGIDFHTSFSGPYLLVMDSLSKRTTPLTDNWISEIKEQRKEELDIRPRSQDLPYCYNWMITQLDMEAVTYEEGDEIDRTIVKKRAQDYAKYLMTTLLDTVK